MPLVRIDLSSDTPETLGPAIGDLVYQAMRDTINVPEHDKFQVITRHAPHELVHPASYLGVAYSPGFVLIQITLNQGRTTAPEGASQQHAAPGQGGRRSCVH